ncbi:BrnA antitoxin family protein [Microgenomates group bacterium]|nr:BrnA antitoxin family protein [Microgenomates group bacterium]
MKKMLNSEDLERRFDRGEDLSEFVDWSSAKVLGPLKQKKEKINLDLPTSVLTKVDAEANKVGVPRQSLIKMWIAERLGII